MVFASDLSDTDGTSSMTCDEGTRCTFVAAAGMPRRLRGHRDVLLEGGEESISLSLSLNLSCRLRPQTANKDAVNTSL